MLRLRKYIDNCRNTNGSSPDHLLFKTTASGIALTVLLATIFMFVSQPFSHTNLKDFLYAGCYAMASTFSVSAFSLSRKAKDNATYLRGMTYFGFAFALVIAPQVIEFVFYPDIFVFPTPQEQHGEISASHECQVKRPAEHPNFPSDTQ